MRIRETIQELAEGLRDAIAPARCIDCLTEGTWYCSSCRRHTPPHILRCIGCKNERFRGTTCNECVEDVPLTGFISAREYSDHSAQRGIEWLKFKGVRPLAEVLAGLLIPKLSAIAPMDYLSTHAILVPLPLHPGRMRERGFNQSEDIAHVIGSICTIEVRPVLARAVATMSQAHLPHDLRMQNTENAFSLQMPEEEYANLIKTKPIVIIIDDVSTTGATLMSAAKALPIHPNVQVWGAAIARG